MSEQAPILPFYHPTSVVLVDDDTTFLESMEFALCDEFNCTTFEKPKKAAAFLKEQVSDIAAKEASLLFPTSNHSDVAYLNPGDRTVGVKASFVPNLLADKDRFSRPSVLIVDYSMPGMTGVELLQEIKDLPICKILLTGKADKKVGIEAFNKGLIDCFLTKHHADLVDELPDKVKELQLTFFERLTKTLRSIVSMELTDFIKDEAFNRSFEKVKNQLNIAEYYLVSEPQGILLISDAGKMSFMQVADKQKRQMDYEIAEDQDAPVELLTALRQPNILSLFPSHSGFYEPAFENDWKPYLSAAEEIEGSRNWWYSILNNPSVFRAPVQDRDLYSYNAFMNPERRVA